MSEILSLTNVFQFSRESIEGGERKIDEKRSNSETCI